MRGARAALTILLVGLFTIGAPRLTFADDPPKHLLTGATCTTGGGSTIKLDPGYYLTETSYNRLDAELKRLQEAETRLTAENQRLRDLTRSGGVSTLKWLGYGFLAGAAVGAGVVGYYALK